MGVTHLCLFLPPPTCTHTHDSHTTLRPLSLQGHRKHAHTHAGCTATWRLSNRLLARA